MLSIIVLSNQQEVAASLKSILRASDYHVASLAHSPEALEALAQRPPDLLLFDHGDGSHLQEWPILRREQAILDHTGLLLILRADQAVLLDESPGADDFLLWPVADMELLLRVRRILQRKLSLDAENMLRSGGLVIDLANYKVSVEGRSIELTYKEYELLRFLASNKDRVYTREALLNRVWGYDYFGGARTVDVHIRRLRSKIEDRDHAFIETIRNVGYRFHESEGRGARATAPENSSDVGPECYI